MAVQIESLRFHATAALAPRDETSDLGRSGLDLADRIGATSVHIATLNRRRAFRSPDPVGRIDHVEPFADLPILVGDCARHQTISGLAVMQTVPGQIGSMSGNSAYRSASGAPWPSPRRRR